MILRVRLEAGGFRDEPVSVVPLRGSVREGEVDLIEVSDPQQSFSMRARAVKAGDVIVWQGSHWEIKGVQATSFQRTVVHTQQVPASDVAARYAFVFCDGALALLEGRRIFATVEGA